MQRAPGAVLQCAGIKATPCPARSWNRLRRKVEALITLFFREAGGQVIVVSEPFDKETDWTEVPSNHALIARASDRVNIVPFELAISAASDAEPVPVRRIIARR